MKWSIPIIAVALSACILFGSIGFGDTTKETTEYSPVLTDLAAIADYDQVTEEVNYNPLKNVTGWSSNVSYVTQSQASLYRYYQSNEFTSASKTWNFIDVPTSSGGLDPTVGYPRLVIPTPEGTYNYEWSWESPDPSVTAAAGRVDEWTSGFAGGFNANMSYQFVIEGHTIERAYQSSIFITNTTTSEDYQSTSDNVYFCLMGGDTIGPNNMIHQIKMEEGSIVNVSFNTNTGRGVAGLKSFSGESGYSYTANDSSDSSGLYVTETIIAQLGTTSSDLLSGEFILQNGVWYKITDYDSLSGEPHWDESISCKYLINIQNNTSDYTVDYRIWSVGDVVYIKPYTPITFTAGNATWQNGYNNTKVQFLLSAEDTYFTVNGTSSPSSSLSSTIPDMAIWGTDYSGMILVTVDGTNGVSYWQGVTSYTDNQNFTVAGYKYYFNSSNQPGTVTAAGSSISSITVYNLGTGTAQAAIVDTWMLQDYSGLLWQDATFPIDSAFATLWTTENIRVSFNSFVTTGTGITINGTTYPVTDGVITFEDTSCKVAGSSITWDYSTGATTWIAPNGDTVDLGTRSGTFTLNGVWYGALSMDTYTVVVTPTTEMLFGQHAEDSWRSWVFLGVLVLGVAAVLATRRELDSLDMLILFFAGAVGLIMGVTL